MVYKPLVQSIGSYALTIWGSAYITHTMKLRINSLIKNWFHKPKFHYTSLLHKPLQIFHLTYLHFYFVRALLFKYKNTINLLYSTNNSVIIKKINMDIPKLNTTFSQSGLYYAFVNFCIKFKINFYDFYDLNNIKKIIATSYHNDVWYRSYFYTI